jgi:2-oxo-hept-3-ene-1,7-dioate hydratase
MTKDEIAKAASALAQAETARTPIAPLSAANEGMTIQDAYAIQDAWIAMKCAAGKQIRGHKIGLTSRPMQRLVDFHEPDYGCLLDDMFYEDAAAIPHDRFIAPMVECEIAFVLGRPLSGPNCTIVDVLKATDYVMPALEIIDNRMLMVDPMTHKRRTIFDAISDNASNGALVLGGRAVRPDAVDLRWVAAICSRNLVIEETGVAAAVLNHPARGVAWLANKLALHGTTLEAGEIVLGGSFTRIVEARAGDQFHVDYGPLGTVSCSFA